MKPISLHIIDTTLRDGEQAPGVVFSLHEKLKIAQMLDKVGIPEVEIGMPAMSENETTDARIICTAGFQFRSLGWCRANKQDIDCAAKAKCDRVHISLPVSEIHLNSLGKNRKWVIDTMRQVVGYAKERFELVSIGAQDASRANQAFLQEFISEGVEKGVKRVRIADTVGIMNPFTVSRLFEELAVDFPDTILEFHGHNDLGMATANALAAVASGANAVSVTVNGLGERAGNTSLEELIMALKISMGYELAYQTEHFCSLCALVEQASGRQNALSKPISGTMVMCHESGIHTNSLLKNLNSYQILRPEMIGTKQPSFIFGKHSGSNAITSFFQNKGMVVTKEQSHYLLNLVKNMSVERKRSVTENELLSIYNCLT